jgi:hypothetical protein
MNFIHTSSISNSMFVDRNSSKVHRNYLLTFFTFNFSLTQSVHNDCITGRSWWLDWLSAYWTIKQILIKFGIMEPKLKFVKQDWCETQIKTIIFINSSICENMDFTKICNLHLKQFCVWWIFNKIQVETISNCRQCEQICNNVVLGKLWWNWLLVFIYFALSSWKKIAYFDSDRFE